MDYVYEKQPKRWRENGMIKIVNLKEETYNRLKQFRDDTFCKSFSESVDVLFQTNEALIKEIEKLSVILKDGGT